MYNGHNTAVDVILSKYTCTGRL